MERREGGREGREGEGREGGRIGTSSLNTRTRPGNDRMSVEEYERRRSLPPSLTSSLPRREVVWVGREAGATRSGGFSGSAGERRMAESSLPLPSHSPPSSSSSSSSSSNVLSCIDWEAHKDAMPPSFSRAAKPGGEGREK